VWDLSSGKLIKTLKGHTDIISSVAFSPGGKSVASASYDNTIKIWDLGNMEIIHALTNHERSVMSIKFSNDDKFLVSGSYDATVRLWDVKRGEQIHSFVGHSSAVNDIDISFNNQYIISASSDNTINVWEIHPEILIEYYYSNEFQNDIENSKLFDPKKSGESRTEYKERLLKAEKFKTDLYLKYLKLINKTE